MENLEGQVFPDQPPQPLLTSENIVEERGKIGDRTEVRVRPCPPPQPLRLRSPPPRSGRGAKVQISFGGGVLYTGAWGRSWRRNQKNRRKATATLTHADPQLRACIKSQTLPISQE